jgi:hypothetical protein
VQKTASKTIDSSSKRGSAVTRSNATNSKAKGITAAVNGFAAFLKTLKPADAKTAIASATRYSRVVKEQSGSESHAFKSHFQVCTRVCYNVLIQRVVVHHVIDVLHNMTVWHTTARTYIYTDIAGCCYY